MVLSENDKRMSGNTVVILFLPLQPTTTNLCVQTTSSVISTGNVPLEGWDGRAPQGLIIPPDSSYPPQLKNSLPMN